MQQRLGWQFGTDHYVQREGEKDAALVAHTDVVLLVGQVVRAGAGRPLTFDDALAVVLTINVRVAAVGSANGKSKQLDKDFHKNSKLKLL